MAYFVFAAIRQDTHVRAKELVLEYADTRHGRGGSRSAQEDPFGTNYQCSNNDIHYDVSAERLVFALTLKNASETL